MAHKIKKKYIIIFIILISAALLLAASYFIEISKIPPKTEASLKENQNILPVLYYEQNSGFWGIGTYTYLLEDGKITELEEHGRTFSRTRPASAYEKLKEKHPSVADYGRLVVYYNSPEGEIAVFEHNKTNDFTVIKNGIKAVVPQDQYETYHEFLSFGEKYYLFTLPRHDEDVLRVYRLSENLETEEFFDIAYGELGIPGHALVGDSFAVAGNNLFIVFENRILKYDMETGETEFITPGRSLIAVVADGSCFHAAGTEENGNFVFETFDSEGKSLRKTEAPLPFGFGYSPYEFNTDETLYMYGSEIYLRFAYDEKCYILSFDMESEEWTNYWIAEKESFPKNPGNVKFVIAENGNYYDLFPFLNNK